MVAISVDEVNPFTVYDPDWILIQKLVEWTKKGFPLSNKTGVFLREAFEIVCVKIVLRTHGVIITKH